MLGGKTYNSTQSFFVLTYNSTHHFFVGKNKVGGGGTTRCEGKHEKKVVGGKVPQSAGQKKKLKKQRSTTAGVPLCERICLQRIFFSKKKILLKANGSTTAGVSLCER